MSLAEPLVSVTLITYNHEKYIGQAIQSVLDQTYRDLELVVVNDGSTDGTAEVINSFSDPRMRVFHHPNQGPSVTANRALAECRGRYLAVMAGDDLLPPNRIERQLTEYLKGGSRVLFSQFDVIDEEGTPTETSWYNSNRTPAHGRAQVLRRLFEGSAPAMILTLFTETRIIREEHPYCDPTLHQMHDYDLQVRLAKKYEFAYLDEPLYRFRLRRGHLNLSGSDPHKLIRTWNEFYLLMRNFFDDIPAELFKEMFPDLVRKPGFTTPLEYKCEQAFVWLKSPSAPLRLRGAEKLYDLLHDSEASSLLARQYGFTYKSFAETTKQLDLERRFPDRSDLFVDTGAGFDAAVRVMAPTSQAIEEFTLNFDLSKIGPVRAVCWTPVEGRYSKVRLSDVCYWDAAGKITYMDLASIASNGHLLPDGTHLFLNIVPMFSLPLEGDIAGVAIKGRWWNRLGSRGEQLRQTTLYPDDGHNFREEIAVHKGAYLEEETFSLTFNLSGTGPVRCLRWDPVENCFCKVRLDSVTYRDTFGASHSLDIAKIVSNGALLTSGAHLFDTIDPMFFLPIEGNIQTVTLQGRWWGPLSAAEVARQKPGGQAANEGPPRWVRRIVNGGVQQLRKLKRRAFIE